MRHACIALTVLSCLLAVGYCHAQQAQQASGWAYGDDGLQWSNPDSGSYLTLGLRFQPRYSNREDEPLVPEDLREEGESGVSMNRARYKIEAGLGRHFVAYHEYDLVNGRLLDLRGTWMPASWLHLRGGQWKADYNRERVDSSGKQQFVDRSIVNYWFTIDRQIGLMASGRLAPGQRADSSWWLGLLNGTGLNTSGDGGAPMWMARWQWNFTRQVLPFSQSALQRYETPHGSFSFGAVRNDSPYTRYSSSGGGQLPGFADGTDNQYRISQLMQEFAWQHGGWSVQQELHLKKIEDRINGGRRTMYGGYLMAGWFPVERFKDWPSELELAARVAMVNSNRGAGSDRNTEFTLGANWFFKGHRNKLTIDTSWLGIDDPAGEDQDGWRVRAQWDISL